MRKSVRFAAVPCWPSSPRSGINVPGLGDQDPVTAGSIGFICGQSCVIGSGLTTRAQRSMAG